MSVSKLRIAIVVQRYGNEINGGAEFHARLVAEELANYYDVEVMTTCALRWIDLPLPIKKVAALHLQDMTSNSLSTKLLQ